jgi:hypothetical protein
VFAATALLSLALGISANAAIFQLIDTLRFRSLSTMIGAAALLGTAAAVAGAIPAWRAPRISPDIALRCE